MTERFQRSRLVELEAENATLRGRLAAVKADLAASEGEAVSVAESERAFRNTLAVIRAIIRHSLVTSRSADDFATHLIGRVDAVARVHQLASNAGSDQHDLHSLIADELLVHLVREGERLHLSGPRILLQPKSAELLALAIHELAANAVEHGALGSPEGEARVTWSVSPPDAQGVPTLAIQWRERGPGGLPRPRHHGFGTEVLKQTLAYALQARARLEWEETGLSCLIQIPLTSRIGRLTL